MSIVPELGVRSNDDALLAVVGPIGGLRVIDIGSAHGALAGLLAERGAEVTGVDPLAPAQPWTDAGRGRYRLLQASAEALPFADGSVDLVLFVFSLHHLPIATVPAVLAEVARVLRPGGRLYVAEPVAEGPFQEVTGLFHDETEIRKQAAQALAAASDGPFRVVLRRSYLSRRIYDGFDSYAARMAANMRFNDFTEAQLRAEPVRQRFEAVSARTGGVFDLPVRIDLLERQHQ